MEIIPVIDLKGKQVVGAKMGERHLYMPLTTPLAATSTPEDVIRGFLSLHSFRSIYIADLDAIEGLGSHDDILTNLQATFPDLNFWVDFGVKSLPEANIWLRHNRAQLVVGSESWQDVASLTSLRDEPRLILSLDFRGEVFQGSQRMLDTRLWPRRLIVMTLARVGSDAGPDVARVAAIVKQAGSRLVYAAGGLRDKEDLQHLRKAGASGVLVASALHSGRLKAEDLGRQA